MAKQAISYPLRVYDEKLWKRMAKKAKANKTTGGSMNAEIAIAMMKHAPEPKKVSKKK